MHNRMAIPQAGMILHRTAERDHGCIMQPIVAHRQPVRKEQKCMHPAIPVACRPRPTTPGQSHYASESGSQNTGVMLFACCQRIFVCPYKGAKKV